MESGVEIGAWNCQSLGTAGSITGLYGDRKHAIGCVVAAAYFGGGNADWISCVILRLRHPLR